LVLSGDTAYAAEYFSDSLSRISLDGKGTQIAHAIALGPKQPMSVVRWGEQLFHDAEHCFQNWQSCTTCHPSEGRPDGLNWDLLLDGIGNPKNTKNLLLAHQTPPTSALGIRANAEVSVRSGLKFIEFAIRPDEEASAIDEYLKALTPVDSPHLVKGALSESASRGEAVFEEVGCAGCHPSPLYTNMKQYDVGTGRGPEENARFDTPTLVELWRTAPYLHDGRAATLRDMLVSPDSDDRHSAMVSDLSEEGLSDLIEFVLSL
jgi:cytochrome c peroxidase